MAVSVVSFSFSMVAQMSTGVGWVLAFLTTSRLLPSSTVLLALLLAYLPLSSIRWPYITFKLPHSNIDTPQCLRNLFRFPATGMCHFLPVHHLEWHFWSTGQNITVQHLVMLFYIDFSYSVHELSNLYKIIASFADQILI